MAMSAREQRYAKAMHEAAHQAMAFERGYTPTAVRIDHPVVGNRADFEGPKNTQDLILIHMAGIAMDRIMEYDLRHRHDGYTHDWQQIWKIAFDGHPKTVTGRTEAVMMVNNCEKIAHDILVGVTSGILKLASKLNKKGRLGQDEIVSILSRHSTRKLALDSNRRYDHDGRLHVAQSRMSKSNVCGYRGDEIPYADQLGLDPNKTYMLLRHPDEIEKAVDSFNGLPVLAEHVPISADDHVHNLVIGTTGSRAQFKPPYLTNDISIWTRDAIDAINGGGKKELSCAYSYMPVMTPGVYNGQSYDGIMTNLRGNHVALVTEGRAGNDCVVGDEANVKTVRRFRMGHAFDQLPRGANAVEKPSAMSTREREKDDAARVGEKLQRQKDKLSDAARTKTGPNPTEQDFDPLRAKVDATSNPRELILIAAQLLKARGYTDEQVAAHIDKVFAAVQEQIAKQAKAPAKDSRFRQRTVRRAAGDEDPKMPLQQPGMQQMEDPNKVSARTNMNRGPTQQESFGRDLSSNTPQIDPRTAGRDDRRPGQAFGIPGPSGAEPGTQAKPNKFANLMALLDALADVDPDLDDENDGEYPPGDVGEEGLIGGAGAQPPSGAQPMPGMAMEDDPQLPMVKKLPNREPSQPPVGLPAKRDTLSVPTGDAALMHQRRAPTQRLDQHLRQSGLRSEAHRKYAANLAQKTRAKSEAIAQDSAANGLDDFLKCYPGAGNVDSLTPTPTTPPRATKRHAHDAASITTWWTNPMTNMVEQIQVSRTDFNKMKYGE